MIALLRHLADPSIKTEMLEEGLNLGKIEKSNTEMKEIHHVVRKHAEAKKIRIDLQIKGDFAELVIEDDGNGFNYQSDQTPNHFGLRIMRERAENLGGTFLIESTPVDGTRITALLPLYPTN